MFLLSLLAGTGCLVTWVYYINNSKLYMTIKDFSRNHLSFCYVKKQKHILNISWNYFKALDIFIVAAECWSFVLATKLHVISRIPQWFSTEKYHIKRLSLKVWKWCIKIDNEDLTYLLRFNQILSKIDTSLTWEVLYVLLYFIYYLPVSLLNTVFFSSYWDMCVFLPHTANG